MQKSDLLFLSTNDFGRLDLHLQSKVYREFYRMVYRIIIRYVRVHAATEDIIQESFIKIVRYAPEVEDTTQLKRWIIVVVKNTTFNYIRKIIKRNETALESNHIYDNLDFATKPELIEEKVEVKEMAETIEQHINNLKPQFSSLMKMRWKKEMSYKELAKAQGVTEEKVKYRLYRARNTIKKLIKDK